MNDQMNYHIKKTSRMGFQTQEKKKQRRISRIYPFYYRRYKTKIDRDLVKAKDEAQANVMAKSEFLSRMSHELRTPLNAIIGMTTIAIMETKQDKKEYCLKQIDIFSKQLLAIINDILDVSKIEANRFELEEREFNFEKMLQNVISLTSVKINEKQQHFDCQCMPFTAMVTGDELRISQVLINLITNASKFTPYEGKITLKISGDETQAAAGTMNGQNKIKLRVEVKDTGIGISPEQQKRLFNSFVQAETGTTRKFGGTGLGLVICKKIIKLMGSDIRVESELGKGSSFIFEIMANLGRPLNEGKEEKEEVPAMPARNWKNKAILIVEDIEINREIINTILEETQISIDNAADGIEALEMYKKNPGKYDLIFMDIHMPKLDGLGATRAIRAFEAEQGAVRPHGVPIIAMTASAFSTDMEDCLKAGMNRHLLKPIEITEIFKVLDEYLESVYNNDGYMASCGNSLRS